MIFEWLESFELKRQIVQSSGSRTRVNAVGVYRDIEKYRVRTKSVDLRTGIDELKNAAPQNEEERHDIFLLKNRW